MPEGWVWCKVEDIGEVITGNTPSKDKVEYYGGDIPFFKPTDLEQGIDTKYASDYLSERGFEQSRKLPANTILVTCIGATIGKTGIITVAGSCNQQINAIVPNWQVTHSFIYYVCISDYMQSEIKSNASATTLPILNKGDFSNLLFPLPPIVEQYRIVKEIEHWFALIDQIEQGKTYLLGTIKQTKSKILDLAIHGKLVPQDPNDEPALNLLKRINPDFTPCDNGHSKKLPKDWIVAQLNNIAEIKNGYAFKSSKYLSSNGVRIIRISNVQDGYIEDKMPQFYPVEEMETLKDFMLKEGDMLMSLTGNVGRVGILTNNLLPAALNQRVAHIKESSNVVEKKYLFYLFQTSDFLKDCLKSGKGVAQLNISTEWLKHYFILLPPLSEQQRIVAKIEELFSILDNIQKSLEA